MTLTIAAAALFALHVIAWIVCPDTETESVKELRGSTAAVTQTS
jgi:hypothetical protein